MQELFISLLVFAMVATITPGGATLLASASGAQFGFRRSIPLMAGIAFGLGSLMAVSSAGLSVLLHTYPALQLAMRAIGSAYLLWLAWKIAQSGAPSTDPGASAKPFGFGAGLVLLWINPKAWTMALAAGAAYVGLANDPQQLGLILGVVFCVAASFALSVWCAGGLLLARTLRSEMQWRIVNVSLGLLLAASVVPMWL